MYAARAAASFLWSCVFSSSNTSESRARSSRVALTHVRAREAQLRCTLQRSRRCVRRHRRRIAPLAAMRQSRNLVERAPQVPEARVRAATMLQRMVRGRAARRIHLLLRLAARVQDTYRREQPAYESETSITAGGVARRLEGTLLKLSGIVYQQRNVYVSQLHFRVRCSSVLLALPMRMRSLTTCLCSSASSTAPGRAMSTRRSIWPTGASS